MAQRAKTSRKRGKSEPAHLSLANHFYAQWRFLAALAVGLVTAFVAPLENIIPRILAGWNVGGFIYLVLVWVKMMQAEVEGIKREADIERESRMAVLFIVTFGAIFALLALFVQLMAIKSEHGFERNISIGLSITTIFLSWLLIQTVFAIYYAHEFHSEAHTSARGGGGGGLKFPGDRAPDYLDFLYFSFVIGTTNQTSDIDITSCAMRRVVMLHGILSFFFNTMIIALAVNLAAQLVQGG
jgi:uncharacterized membrane protein